MHISQEEGQHKDHGEISERTSFLSGMVEKVPGIWSLRPVFDFHQEERGGKKQITYFGAVYTAKRSPTLRWEGVVVGVG